jgi:DNA/RNA-binding domain of Phe-tRNA-synthetase-like protein
MDVIIDTSAKESGLVVGHLEIERMQNNKNRNKKLEKLAKKLNQEVKENPQHFLEQETISCYQEYFAGAESNVPHTDTAAKILINLILESGHLPKISRAVDAMNIVSVRSGLTMSMWDADKVNATITYKQSADGEQYWPFMGDEISLLSGELIAEDGEKVLCLVRYRDSKYAPTTPDTVNSIVHIQGVNGITAQKIEPTLSELEELILSTTGGKTIEKKIV